MLKKSINTMIITMISRILGLFRGTLVAYFFGASVLTDAYYSAFKISNFFRQLLVPARRPGTPPSASQPSFRQQLLGRNLVAVDRAQGLLVGSSL